MGIDVLTANPAFTPFLQAGVGFLNYSQNNSKKSYAGMLIGGCGIIAPIRSKWSILFSIDVRYTTEDNFNQINLGSNDAILSLQSGFLYCFRESTQQFIKKQNMQEMEIIAQSTKSRQEENIKIRTKIKNLKNEINKCNHEIDEIRLLLKTNESKIDSINKNIMELKQFVRDSIIQKQQKQSDVPSKYKDALRQFEAGNYVVALKEFKALYENYKSHPLYLNFIYWIGECHFGMKNYDEAIKNFEKITVQPTHDKTDDALIMQGISYKRLGNEARAKQKFVELLRKFPSSEFAGRAKKYLKSF